MNLCFLGSAASIHSKKWIEYFVNKRYHVSWISLVSSDFGEFKDLDFYLFQKYPFKIFDILFNFFSVRNLVQRLKPDILNVHYGGVYGVIGALIGIHPFLVSVYGSDVLVAPKSRIGRIFIKFVLKKADLITCDAEHVKRAMMELGTDEAKIKIINFGIDTKKFSPGPKNKEIQRELDIVDKPTVISLRKFKRIYDVETLIRAIPFVLKEFPDTKFILGGKGPQKEILEELIKKLGVEKNVKFLGWLPNDQLPDYLRTFDVYVSTSLSDGGIAASTAEAMACGLPVVVTDIGDNTRWVKDNKGGFVVPIKEYKLLAEKIIFLLKNKERRENFGRFNRKIIEEKNNYYKEMEKVDEIYKEFTK